MHCVVSASSFSAPLSRRSWSLNTPLKSRAGLQLTGSEARSTSALKAGSLHTICLSPASQRSGSSSEDPVL